MSKTALKNKKKQERKLKNEAKEKNQEAAAVKIEVNYVSDLVLKLTGNPEVDRQLKDLKKVTSHSICFNYQNLNLLLLVETRSNWKTKA